jgi:hypothetical protein
MSNKESNFTHPIKAYENAEFINSRDGRLLRIMSEYLYPELNLKKHHVANTIVVFGSARTMSTKAWKRKKSELSKNIKLEKNKTVLAKLEKEFARHLKLEFTSKYYDETVKLVELITNWTKNLPTNKKFFICTGGGGGMMEAANQGAYNTKAENIGFNIQLPFEQQPNPYITPELNFEFHYFFMRKFWFAYHAKAMIAMPGGFGTMDELFEILTLVQTGILTKKMPIILYGKEFWHELLNFKFLSDIAMINEEDLSLFHYCDSPQEAFECLKTELSELLFIDKFEE